MISGTEFAFTRISDKANIMNARLLSLFLLVLLFWSGQARAQSKVIYDQKKLESLTLSSADHAELHSIAVDLGYVSSRSRTTRLLLPVEFEQQERITRDGNQINFTASLKNMRVRERVLYREFDFAEALVPATITAKVQLLGAEDKVLQTFDVYTKDIDQNGTTVLAQSFIKDTTAFNGYKVRVVETKLGFSAKNRSLVRERKELVNRYYDTDARLAQLSRDLQTINPNDIDRLAQHGERLKALEVEMDRAVDSKMERELGLRQHDPVQLMRRARDLDSRLRERRAALDQMWARLPEIFYNRGLELAMNGNARAARDFFERSVAANPAFAPSHLQLARLDLQAGYLKESAQRTRDLLNRMQPDPETFRFAQELALNIQNEYVRFGEQLNNQGNYHQALQQFEEAREFCRGISSLRCRPELWESGIAYATNGIYDNLLQAGRTALHGKNLPQAEKLAREAQAYARNNRTFIRTDAAAQTLMRDVQQQVYVNHMASGRKTLQARQYADALASFEKAKSVAAEYDLKEQADATSLLRQAAKPVILARINDGQQQAANNRLAQARTIAAEVTNLQVKYNLVSDKELDAKFRQLSQGIFSQECANAQASYEQHYQRSLQLSRQGQFAQAAAALDQALAAAKENGGCAISTATADAELVRIDAPAHYQETLQKVEYLISQNKMTEAVQLYLQAGQQFAEDGVERFGLQHAPLLALAARHENKTFVAEVARHTAAHGEAAAAIDLIKRLVSLKYTKYNLNQLQEQVGEQLAVRDVQANPKANYKQQAETYTGGNKDLKKLNKAYQKKFKKLT